MTDAQVCRLGKALAYAGMAGMFGTMLTVKPRGLDILIFGNLSWLLALVGMTLVWVFREHQPPQKGE